VEPSFCGGFHHIGRDSTHAAMVDRAMAEKAWAAIWPFLNDGAARRYRGRAIPVSRAKHGNDWQSHSSRHVHRSGIVANEKMTLRKQRREIGNGRLLREVDRRPAELRTNGASDGRFGGCSEENYVAIDLRPQAIRDLGKS